MERILEKLLLAVVRLVALCLLGLLLVEGVLWLGYRVTYGKASVPPFRLEAWRIWARSPNGRAQRRHPDTGKPHRLWHNALGLRQHREFPPARLRANTTVAFFGGSNVEGIRLPVQHSFSEILDHLLNANEPRFEVLNFGVEGYGIDQSALHYHAHTPKLRLDHVFYFFNTGEVRNIAETRLFHLDGRSRLSRTPSPEAPWWLPVMSRLYLSYAITGAYARWIGFRHERTGWGMAGPRNLEHLRLALAFERRYRSSEVEAVDEVVEGGGTSKRVAHLTRLLRATLHDWRRRVEAAGGTFTVAIAADYDSHRHWRRILGRQEAALDLTERLRRQVPGYRYEAIRFQKDSHWSEAANHLVAVALYRHLEKRLALSRKSDAWIAERLRDYYGAFPAGWRPRNLPRDGGTDVATRAATHAAIRRRTLGLETP